MYMYYGLCSVTLSDPSVDPSGGPWKTPRHFITCEHMQQTCNRQTMRIPFFADDRCRSTRCGFSRGLRARHHEVSHLPARFKPLAATVQKTPAERGLGPKKTNYRMFVSFCVHFWTGSTSDPIGKCTNRGAPLYPMPHGLWRDLSKSTGPFRETPPFQNPSRR